MEHGKMKAATEGVLTVGMFLFVFLLAQGMSMGEVLKATPDQFNFGSVKEGDPVEIVVEIENTGSAPVEITNVQTS